MNFSWLTTVLPIAALFSFRMLGLFMLIPVFTVLAHSLVGANPSLIGIALGAYGLSQGLLQIPFGMLSDKFGRKPMIALGLLFLIAGSLLGALTTSIYGMIFARILQGMGAIGAVLIALLADLSPEKERTKAMAVIGLVIGLSFALAMVLSPILTHAYGLSGIFYLTTLLGLLGFTLLFFAIPNPQRESFHAEAEADPKRLTSVLKNKTLLPLNLGIFFQHFILTATFYLLPMMLQQSGTLVHVWQFYLPIMILSFLLMFPLIMIAEKKASSLVFPSAIATILLSQLLLMMLPATRISLGLILILYFIAFNFLEASLPSLISKKADKRTKGTALGVYSSCQFLGIFFGGIMAGFIIHYGYVNGIFILNAAFSLLWLILSRNIAAKEKNES